jgi:hypothetical protein
MLLQPYLVTASERMGIFCAKKGRRASPSPSVVDLLDTALDADGNFPLTCRGSEQPCGRYRSASRQKMSSLHIAAVGG